MKIRSKNGITLIALVITIVVLLILSGVAVSQLISENGLLLSMLGIGDGIKKDLDNASDGMQENIEDTLDNGVGANKGSHEEVELKLVNSYAKTATVELKLTNYELIDNENKNRTIDKIVYAIKESNTNYSGYKEGDISKYKCSFSGLNPGTYYIGAFAEYRDNDGNFKRAPIGNEVFLKINDLPFEIGDWVDYDAGKWTEGEIQALGSSYASEWKSYETKYANHKKGVTIDEKTQVNKFSGMAINSSKNNTLTYSRTGVSGSEFNLDGAATIRPADPVINKVKYGGWRILDITDAGEIILVSAGIPEYYISRACYTNVTISDHSYNNDPWHASLMTFYVEEECLQGIKNRKFSEYINNTYAESARMMTYGDVNTAIRKGPKDLANIGATYIQATVNKGDKYYSVSEALNRGIYGSNSKNSWLTFYNNSFSDGIGYSAGILGVRVVVTLNPIWTVSKKDANGNTKTGKSYDSPLHLVEYTPNK